MASWAYATLGLNDGASLEDVKKAYRKKAMQHHPDRGGDEEQFKKIQAAYEHIQQVGDHVKFARPTNKSFKSSDFTDVNFDPRRMAELMEMMSKLDSINDFIKKSEEYKEKNNIIVLNDVSWESAFHGTTGIKKGVPPGGHFLAGDLTVRVNSIKLMEGFRFVNTFQSNEEMFLGDIICSMSFTEQQLRDGMWFKMKSPFEPDVVLQIRLPSNSRTDTILKIKGAGYWNWKRQAISRGNLYIRIQQE